MTDLPDVLVISPHSDDAAFSLAVTLKLLGDAGCCISIINCFSETRFAPFAVSEPSDARQLRRNEDEAFRERLGALAKVTDLGFLDALARGGLRAIFLSEPESPSTRFLVASLQARLPNRSRDSPIFVPLGAGGHSDHLIARRAAIAKYRDRPLAFYEDLPYAASSSVVVLESIVHNLETDLKTTLSPWLVNWRNASAFKSEVCQIYRSQVSVAKVQKMIRYWDMISGERLWVTSEFRKGAISTLRWM